MLVVWQSTLYLEGSLDVCSKLFHISELSVNHFGSLVQNASRNISGHLSLVNKR